MLTPFMRVTGRHSGSNTRDLLNVSACDLRGDSVS